MYQCIKQFKKISADEQGVLMMDFIFAFMLLIGFSVILFSISFTLTVTEVLQYVTFSSARVYAVADESETTSIGEAQRKFEQLYNSDVVRPLFRNQWFELIDSGPEIGKPRESLADNPLRDSFYGVRLAFVAKILDKNIPLIGSTNKSLEGGSYETIVSSFLGKEPSLEDCRRFIENRWGWLKALDDYQNIEYPEGSLNKDEHIADNGC